LQQSPHCVDAADTRRVVHGPNSRRVVHAKMLYLRSTTGSVSVQRSLAEANKTELILISGEL